MHSLHPARAGASIAALCLLAFCPIRAASTPTDPVPSLRLECWDHDVNAWFTESGEMPYSMYENVTKFRVAGDPQDHAGTSFTVSFSLSIPDAEFFTGDYAYTSAFLSVPTAEEFASVVPTTGGHDYSEMPDVALRSWQFLDKVEAGAYDESLSPYHCRNLMIPLPQLSGNGDTFWGLDIDYPTWVSPYEEWWTNLHSPRAPDDYISLDVLVTVLLKEQFAHAGYGQPSAQFIEDAYAAGILIEAQVVGLIGSNVDPTTVNPTDNLFVSDDLPGLVLSQSASKWKTSLQLGYQLGIAATGRPHPKNGPFSGGTVHSIVSPGGTATTPATRMYANPYIQLKSQGPPPVVILTCSLQESATPGRGEFTIPSNAPSRTYEEYRMYNDHGSTLLNVADRNTFFVP